jgi:hypothetical protein
MDQPNSERDQPSSEQQMYWQEFVQLKTGACYIRDYRNDIGRWVTAIATIRCLRAKGLGGNCRRPVLGSTDTQAAPSVEIPEANARG